MWNETAQKKESALHTACVAFKPVGSADPGGEFSSLPVVNSAGKSLAQKRDCSKPYRIKGAKDRGPMRVLSFPLGSTGHFYFLLRIPFTRVPMWGKKSEQRK